MRAVRVDNSSFVSLLAVVPRGIDYCAGLPHRITLLLCLRWRRRY